MKTTDSVMSQLDSEFGQWDPISKKTCVSEKLKTFLSHSLAEARREERERILTMAHNIRSELKEPGYISLTRLEDLLTGDNPSK